MQFLKPEFMFYLWLVPAIFLVYIFSHQVWEKRLKRLIHEKILIPKLLEGYRPLEWLLRAVLISIAVLFIILALSRPQWGDEKKTLKRKGVDLIFMVDTSLSMLAEDIKPNRLEKAKFEIESFVRSLQGDRVGMVTFAGSGFLQTPLTLDHAAFLLFLDAVQVGFLPDPGTSLSQAIHMAIQAFPQKELKYKALILFTDGEDHEGGIDQALQEARQAHARIYTIGLGTTEGEPIPLKNEKGERSGFKKDRQGQMVITRLNPPLLERIAKETEGIYLPATPGEKEVDFVLKHLRGWGEQEFSEKTLVEKEDQYQVFLLIAFFCLIAETLIKRRRKKGLGMAVIATFFLFTGFLETSQGTIEKGNKDFENKRYQSALEAYRKVQVKNPDAPELLYNLGTALYKVNAYQESAKDLEAATGKTKDPKLQVQTLYNYGNTQYRLGNFEKAIETYKKVLDLDPNDKDAKYNLEFLEKQKEKFEKKDQERKKDNPKKQPEQQKNQQNQQQQSQGQQKQQEQQSQGEQEQQQQQQNQQSQNQNQDQQQPKLQDQNQGEQQEQKKQPNQQESEQQGQEKQPDQQESKQQGQEKQPQQQEQEQQKQEQQQQQMGQDQQQDNQERRPGRSVRPLQGQMTKESALNLLDALKESEKELQNLRRPPVDKNPSPVDKDW